MSIAVVAAIVDGDSASASGSTSGVAVGKCSATTSSGSGLKTTAAVSEPSPGNEPRTSASDGLTWTGAASE